MPAPKFNFIPETQLNKEVGEGTWKVTLVDTKTSYTLYFPKDMVNVLELDGKYFRFFADTEKKSIGWVIEEGLTTIEALNDSRKANKNSQSGALMFGIGRIIKALNYKPTGTIKDLEVKTYSSPLVKNPISYVTLPDIEVETSKSQNQESPISIEAKETVG